jgi:hypothetical protein
MDADLQQRAVEYSSLEKKLDVARRNVQAMPPWLKRRSLLLRRMAEKEVRQGFRSFPSHNLLGYVLRIC